MREGRVRKGWSRKGYKMGKDLRIILRKSMIGRPARQVLVLSGLGLRRINASVVRADTPTIRGMIRKVAHLVDVQQVDGGEGA